MESKKDKIVPCRFKDEVLLRMDEAIRKAGPEWDRSKFIKQAVREKLERDTKEVADVGSSQDTGN